MQGLSPVVFLLLLTVTPCRGAATSNFNQIVNDFWDWRLEESPEFATSIGENQYNDRLTSYNITVYPRRKAKVDEFISKLNEIEWKSLDKATQLNYEIFKESLTTFSEGFQWFEYGALNPVSFLGGFQRNPSSIAAVPFKTKQDYENYLSRLGLIEVMLAEQTELFRKAIAVNKTLNLVSVNRIPGQIDKIIGVDDATQLSLFGPFSETLDNITSISDTDKATLRDTAETVLNDNVIRPYRAFKTFLENEYIPNTRVGWGVGSWPNGQEYYKACLKWHLSVNTTAQEIHDLGKQEVERISGLMLKVIRQHGYQGTIREYFQILKANDSFKLETADKILQEYRHIIFQRVMPNLHNYFINIPNLPLEVRPMPNDGAPGSYSSGSADGSRPGVFWANVLRPESTYTFVMMGIALHEANPGHHMQISRSLLLDLPLIRRYRYGFGSAGVPFNFPSYTAYTEGWGLYSEYLGEEMGMYKDDYELLGRYSGEIFRACRLVVDSGIHAFGWEREDAIQYMLNYSSFDRPDIEVEIDRYITSPGQACAYKYGEITILNLRRKAEQELGDKFDLKKFHDVVIGVAPVPLHVLESAVNEMINEELNRVTAEPRGSGFVIYSSHFVVFSSLFLILITYRR